jgi:hypothetical protein
VNKLDIDWPVNKGLTSLTLKGLLIQDIPAGLGNLKELLGDRMVVGFTTIYAISTYHH